MWMRAIDVYKDLGKYSYAYHEIAKVIRSGKKDCLLCIKFDRD